MSIPKDVQEAEIDRFNSHFHTRATSLSLTAELRMDEWDAILAHISAQDAEIERLTVINRKLGLNVCLLPSNALAPNRNARGEGMKVTDDVHSCSYFCDRPECIKAQRNELRDQRNSMLVPDEKYHELLMAVASKFPNESRHETALRYITERENRPSDGPCTAAPSPTNEGE